jgi:hypothetical protein
MKIDFPEKIEITIQFLIPKSKTFANTDWPFP